PGRAHRPVTVRLEAVAGRAAHRLEVGPGAERAAGSAQDSDAARLVRLELAEGISEGRGSRPVDRVARPGAIDYDGGDRPGPLHAHGHGLSSPLRSASGAGKG